MPELPEVETIRKQLQANIVGQIIKFVDVLYPKVVQGLTVKQFERALAGKRVKEIGRQGKWILIRLQGNKTLVVHLKLTGRFLLSKNTHPSLYRLELKVANSSDRTEFATQPLRGDAGMVMKSTEVIFTMSNGAVLLYDDLRRFGFMKILPTSRETEFLQKQKLGMDFFDKLFTAQKFKELIHGRGGSQIKPLLMNQSFIAGIGNIYAQESCFAARVHPSRKADTLNDIEIEALYKALFTIMKKAVKYHGSSVDDYLDIFGRKGNFAQRLKVYSRKGKPCPRCGMKLSKKAIGGRGTVFCSKCQK